MPKYYNRHTMGQDWGGRRRSNPESAPKVTRKDVLDLASQLGVEVRRDSGNFSTWWGLHKERGWLTLGDTNFIATQTLKRWSSI